MLRLHSPENIELWNPEAPMATFWEIRFQYFITVNSFQLFFHSLLCLWNKKLTKGFFKQYLIP